MPDNFPQVFVEEVVFLLEPIKGAAQSEESLNRFFRRMGWNFDDNSGMAIANIVTTITEIIHLIDVVKEMLESEDAESLEHIINLLSSLKSLFEKVNALTGAFDGANLIASEIAEIIEDIPHVLVVRYLQEKSRLLTEILRWIEVIEVKSSDQTIFNANGKIIRYPYAFEVLNFDNLGRFISNPVQAFKDIYTTPFDRNTIDGAKAFSDKLFPRIGKLAQALGATYVYGIKTPYGIDFGSVGNEMAAGALTIKWQTPLDELYFGTTLAYSPRDRGNLGWIIVPFGELSFDATLGKYYFLINSSLQVGAIIVGEDGSVSFESSAGFTSVSAGLEVVKLAEDDTGVSFLIGEKEGTRLEIGKISTGASFEADTSKLDFDVHLKIEEAKVVIAANGRDGFMAKIIPEDGIEVPFDFLLGYSTQKSLYFGVSAGLELALTVHLDILGILKIDVVYLKIKIQQDGLKAEASISGGIALGPLKAAFEEIGIQAKLDWTKAEKNIGFADASLGFKPPNGVGLSLDAGVVKGGGYLYFDYDREEYAGALELTFSNFLSLKAIGMITTKMPDGSKGFSLLILITVEFSTGIQLGFGVTLTGVGGLLGLNRAANGEALMQGIRSGGVNNIMFPRDVVANAPRIISDLRAFFPAEEGKFLIGPMVKLGWGTPTLVSVSLGVIVEINTQGGFSVESLTILGVLRVVLPDENAALLVLQVQFVGRIEFTKNRAWFFAGMFESRVLFMTIEGEMGMLIDWSANPNFVLSVGGFHPRFTPPPMPFPAPRRVAVELSNSSVYRIRVEGYFAVTSNSVQFGARAELLFKIGDVFEVSGHIGLDALFQFSPFFFSIAISASVSLKIFGMGVFGISLEFTLEGPTPWRAFGQGTISFLFFSFSANFDVTWGEQKDTALPPIPAFPMLKTELEKAPNWKADLPAGQNIHVTLRKLEGSDPDALILHPLGVLRITQRAIPLAITLDKIGNQPVADFKKLDVSEKEGKFAGSDTDESFAIAQFQNKSDAEKLSSPAFEPMKGGIALTAAGSGGFKTSLGVRRIVRYETIILDTEYKRHVRQFVGWIGSLFVHFFAGGAVTKSTLSQHQRLLRDPFPEKVEVPGNLYTVVSVADLTPVSEIFSSEASAREYLQGRVLAEPWLGEELQVMLHSEVN